MSDWHCQSVSEKVMVDEQDFSPVLTSSWCRWTCRSTCRPSPPSPACTGWSGSGLVTPRLAPSWGWMRFLSRAFFYSLEHLKGKTPDVEKEQQEHFGADMNGEGWPTTGAIQIEPIEQCLSEKQLTGRFRCPLTEPKLPHQPPDYLPGQSYQ